MSFHLQLTWMDVFLLFLSVSSESTWGFISETSRIWGAGGNSFKRRCMVPEAEFGFQQNLVLVPAPAHEQGSGHRGQAVHRGNPPAPCRGDLPAPPGLSLELHSKQIL